MQIQPATCPACGASYDPLRAHAVTVIDGRVRAFCSSACRERGVAPPPAKHSVTDTHDAIATPAAPSSAPRLPTDQRVLIAASLTALAAFVLLIVLGKRKQATPVTVAAAVQQPRSAATKAAVAVPARDGADIWIQPLARVARPAIKRDRNLFYAREGLPATECSGVRCSVEIDGAAGAIVMAVHDGVVATVERNPTTGEKGRFVRIYHRGGAIASFYLQLDGIREDLRPGVPVKAGEAIGTISRAPDRSTRPHFRFEFSVSDGPDGSMLFVDPQPLLALWPMRREASMSLRAMEHAPADAAIDDRVNAPRAATERRAVAGAAR